VARRPDPFSAGERRGLESLKKLSGGARPQVVEAGQQLEVIVKVQSPDYVPPGVAVRAQISPRLFTAVVPPSALYELEDDPEVESVSISQALRTIG
jgi:hypothetical protein